MAQPLVLEFTSSHCYPSLSLPHTGAGSAPKGIMHKLGSSLGAAELVLCSVTTPFPHHTGPEKTGSPNPTNGLTHARRFSRGPVK